MLKAVPYQNLTISLGDIQVHFVKGHLYDCVRKSMDLYEVKTEEGKLFYFSSKEMLQEFMVIPEDDL